MLSDVPVEPPQLFKRVSLQEAVVEYLWVDEVGELQFPLLARLVDEPLLQVALLEQHEQRFVVAREARHLCA